MTPLQEMAAGIAALKAEIGGKCEVSLGMGLAWKSAATLSIYPTGLSGQSNETFHVCGDDFGTMIADAQAQWSARKGAIDAAIIRKMALAVIEFHLDRGGCDEAALRSKDFAQADIIKFSALACKEAARLTDSGPFMISIIGGSDDAPIEVEAT